MLLWNKLSIVTNRKFDPDTLYNLLNRKFGTEGYTGTTVIKLWYADGAHYSQRIKRDKAIWLQYQIYVYLGRQADLSRFYFMVWHTNVGGWGDSTTIIQVRKAYMTEPFQLLNWMTDPAERQKILKTDKSKKQGDLEFVKRILMPSLNFSGLS